MLVVIHGAAIMGTTNNYGEIEIDDGSGSTQLEDGMLGTGAWLEDGILCSTTYDYTGVVLLSVVGVVHYSYSSFEVHPRGTNDLVFNETTYTSNCTVQPITSMAIRDIQNCTGACCSSPLLDQQVEVVCAVTFVYSKGLYCQDSMEPWSGIFVYIYGYSDNQDWESFPVGTVVRVAGVVDEYNGLSQISALNGDFSTSTVDDQTIEIWPTIVSSGDLGTYCSSGSGEPYEGMLVEIHGAAIMGTANTWGEIEINDGSGSTQLDDTFFEVDGWLQNEVFCSTTYDYTGAVFLSIVGVVDYAHSSFEILARDANDVVFNESTYTSFCVQPPTPAPTFAPTKLNEVIIAPRSLSLVVDKPNSGSDKLLILNPNDGSMNASIDLLQTAASNSMAWSAYPARFLLEPGEFVEVDITVSSSGLQPGSYELSARVTADFSLGLPVTASIASDVEILARADPGMSTVTVEGTPTLGVLWPGIVIEARDADDYTIDQEGDKFGAMLISSNDMIGNCSNGRWTGAGYSIGCMVPSSLVQAGAWNLTVTLDGTPFFQTTVPMSCAEGYYEDPASTSCELCATGRTICPVGTTLASVQLTAGNWRSGELIRAER